MTRVGFRGELRDEISVRTLLLVVGVSARTRDRVPAGKHEAPSDAAV